MVKCNECGKETENTKYCSRKCAMINRGKTYRPSEETKKKMSMALIGKVPHNKGVSNKKIIECLNCGKETTNPKFCCCSCAATVTNKRKHSDESKKKTSISLKVFALGDAPLEVIDEKRKFWQTQEYSKRMTLSLKEYNQRRIEKLMATQPMETWSKKVRRKYLLEQSNNSCSVCGYNKISPINNNPPLEIHHIDGNKKNNIRENLMVVCLNCHFMVDTKYRFRGRSVKSNDNEPKEAKD